MRTKTDVHHHPPKKNKNEQTMEAGIKKSNKSLTKKTSILYNKVSIFLIDKKEVGQFLASD